MPAASPGHTLVELAAVLTVAGVMLAIGAPALGELRTHARTRAVSHELSTSLALARMAAVGRNHAVSVCAAGPGLACRRDGNWDAGWLVFLDPGRTGQPSGGASLIQQGGPGLPPAPIRVRSSPDRSLVRFLPDGRSSGSNLSIHVCPGDPRVPTISLIVSNGGRVRSERKAIEPALCGPRA